MALIDIDDELKDMVQKFVEKNNIEFPSMKNFVDRAIKKELERMVKK